MNIWFSLALIYFIIGISIVQMGSFHFQVFSELMSFLPLKPQIPAFTVPQLSEAMSVLQDRALELMVSF